MSRQMAARIAAHVRHAHSDGREATAAARPTFLDRFLREADPDGSLPPAERSRRAEHLRRAYFLRLAAKSVAARARRSGRAQRPAAA